MAEYYGVDRITNSQTGDVFHLKDYIDDTAGDGETGKTWSADKLYDFHRALRQIGLNIENGILVIDPVTDVA